MNEYIYLFISICILLIYYISSDNNEVGNDMNCQHLSKIEADFRKVMDIAKNKCKLANPGNIAPIPPLSQKPSNYYPQMHPRYIHQNNRYYNTNTIT
jgi:hypothetical protein